MVLVLFSEACPVGGIVTNRSHPTTRHRVTPHPGLGSVAAGRHIAAQSISVIAARFTVFLILFCSFSFCHPRVVLSKRSVSE